jgi:hypothetical protein
MARILTVIILFSIVSTPGHSKICGKISKAKGLVEVLRIQEGRQNSDNPERFAMRVKKTPFTVHCEDIVVTGKASRAKVKFKKGLLTISSNSRIVIAQYAKRFGGPSLLTLTFGKARTFFEGDKKEKKRDDSLFKVKTPSAVMGVRGTDFYVSYEPNTAQTNHATITGEVEVSQVGTKQKVTVKAGQQVKVEKIPGTVSKEATPLATDTKSDTIPTKLPPKETPTPPPKFVSPEPIKPLVVEPIQPATVKEIQHTSVLAKNEKVFTTKEAVELLGEPEKWEPPPDEIPEDLKDIENVF